MGINDYHLVSQWHVAGTPEEVSDILADAEAFPQWWPEVYLQVDVIEPGDANGVGKLLRLHTRGWLPYTLRWDLRVTESDRPAGFSVTAVGDFNGTGRWTITPHEDGTVARYDWRIRVDKPILAALSFALKPLFAANHRWAMARGEEGLRRELLRRRQDAINAAPAGAAA